MPAPDNLISLCAVRRERLPTAVVVDPITAQADGDRLIWGEGGTSLVWTGENGDLDPRRFDAQIAAKFCELARNWTTDPVARQHLDRALKAMRN